MKFSRKQVKHLLKAVGVSITALEALDSGAGVAELYEVRDLLEHELKRQQKPKTEKQPVGSTSDIDACTQDILQRLGVENDSLRTELVKINADVVGAQHIAQTRATELQAAHNTITTQAARIKELETSESYRSRGWLTVWDTLDELKLLESPKDYETSVLQVVRVISEMHDELVKLRTHVNVIR